MGSWTRFRRRAVVGVVSAALATTAFPASGATSGSVSILVDRTTLPSGQQLTYTVGFEVSGGALENAEIRVFLPRDQFRIYGGFLDMSGGDSREVITDATGATAVFHMGDLTDGTIGSVTLYPLTLAYLPNGTQVAATAVLTGTGFTSATSTSPQTTLMSGARPQVEKDSLYYEVAPGPAGTAVADQPGFNVHYTVKANNECGQAGFLFDTGCLPFRGVLTETLPPSSFLVRATRPQSYVDNATGAPDGPAFQFPGDVPLGVDINDVPPAGFQGAFAIDVYFHPAYARHLSDGRYHQESYQDESGLPATPSTIFAFDRAPILDITVWVPDGVVPETGSVAVTNTVRLQGDLGNGATHDTTTDATAHIHRNVTGSAFKTFLGFNAQECAGYGPGGAWDPVTGAGNQSCVILEKNFGTFHIHVGSSAGFLVDPRVTDKLPPAFQPTHAQGPNADWRVTFSDDPACDQDTPDAAFSAELPPDEARCVRFAADGPVQMTTGAIRLQVTGTVPDLDLPVGGHQRITNRVWLTGPQFDTPATGTQDVAVVDRLYYGGQFSFPEYDPSLFASTIPGGFIGFRIFTDTGFATLGDAAPHDWTIQDDIPPNLEFLSAEVTHGPFDANGDQAPSSCSYNAATRRVACVAPGDLPRAQPNGQSNQFNINIRTRVVDGAGAGFFGNWGCTYSQAPPGSPTNQAGQSLVWNSVSTPNNVCFGNPNAHYFGVGYNIANPPATPPPPRTGNPLVDVDKTRVSPLGSSVDGGDDVAYRIDYRHLPASDGDLHGAFIYDFMGRHPVTGAAVGDVMPEFVSATTDGNSTIAYTCTPGAFISAPGVVWESTPCSGVTGVRWQPRSIIAPSDPPGSYRVGDPAGQLGLVVRVPTDAEAGDDLVNAVGIAATGLPPAAGATLHIRVGGHAPVAQDFELTTQGTDPVVADILPYVTDEDNDVVADATQVLATSAGSAAWNEQQNRLIYTPDPAFTGRTATVEYRVCDATNQCDEAVLTIVFVKTPNAVDDTASVVVGSSVVVDTYANDADENLDEQQWFIYDDFDNGTVELSAGEPGRGPGVFRYTPNAGFTGTDTAQYQVCDADFLCDEATITITVNPAPPEQHAPVANDDTASVSEGGSVEIDVLANDTDVDGDIDPTKVTITTPPTKGTATVDPATGKVTYTSTGAPGSDSFEYEVCDSGDRCDRATAAVSVAALATDLSITKDDGRTTVQPGDTVTYTIVARNAGPGPALGARVTDDVPDALTNVTWTCATTPPSTCPSGGTGDIDALVDLIAGGTATFTLTGVLAGDASGSLSNTASIAAPAGRTDPADGNNTAPDVDTIQPLPTVDAVDDAYVTERNVPLVVPAPGVLGNDILTDPAGTAPPLQASLITGPAHGTLELAADGSFTYTPAAGYAGPDEFTYRACSGSICDSAKMTLDVEATVMATALLAEPGIAEALPGLIIRLGFEARLTDPLGFPLGGQPIVFTVKGKYMCTAFTDGNGVAKCTATIPQLLAMILNFGYEAHFNGAPGLAAAFDHAPIVEVLGISILQP